MSSLRDQLDGIYQKQGRLTPALVVDAARPKTSPLHARFEWNDKVAGEKHRREQAHELIQSVRVKYIQNDKPKDIRAYTAVPRGDGIAPNYEPTEEIVLDDFKRQVVLQQMEREWRTMQARYGDFEEFAALVRASLGSAVA
jgi:hypothetical protein